MTNLGLVAVFFLHVLADAHPVFGTERLSAAAVSKGRVWTGLRLPCKKFEIDRSGDGLGFWVFWPGHFAASMLGGR